jgi:hypothetical protein
MDRRLGKDPYPGGMSESESAPEQEPTLVFPEEGGGPEESGSSDGIEHPAKVMRIAAMARQLLEEVKSAPLDDASRQRLREIYEGSVAELGGVLSDDLREELARLALPFGSASPSEAELRIAHAQLVGWLEGLFHGIQAMLFAQQMESRQRLEEMRRRGLPMGPGAPGDGAPPQSGHGNYL